MAVYGAQHDLDASVRFHLFIISPNNSGSTLLRKAVERSAAVWSLPKEGQHVLGFPGPHTRGSGKALAWNATGDRRAAFADPAAYDWPTAQRAWYFQARARHAEASVFVTSSPPFLLQVAGLRAAFRGARFVFLTRHPLAAAEGILRRTPFDLHPGEHPADVAAAHLIACLERQRQNIDRHGDVGLALRYEDLCADPGATAEALCAFCPALHDLTLDGAISVKGLYEEPVRDMNAEQIDRLSPGIRARLEEHFAARSDALAAFGYAPDGKTLPTGP